jgi:hypothetical protein
MVIVFTTMEELLVSWNSSKQKCVTLSSAEAEYVALCKVAQEVKWGRNMLTPFGWIEPGAITVWEDNKGCIEMTKKKSQFKKTKHIELHYHYIKELVAMERINVNYIPTDLQVADGFTKALTGATFEKFVERLNLLENDGTFLPNDI